MLISENWFPSHNPYSLGNKPSSKVKSVLNSESYYCSSEFDYCSSDSSSSDESDSSSSDESDSSPLPVVKSKTEACLKSKSDSSPSVVVKSAECDDCSVEVRPAKQARLSKDERKVDIVSLLTSSSRDFLVDCKGKQVKVSSLKGKYIFIHFFKLPVYSSEPKGRICWALKSTCAKCPDFQLVVCVKTPPSCDSKLESDLFESFLSGFDRCLGIPLSDSYSYQRISDFMKSGTDLLLSPDGIVLDQLASCYLLEYGAYAFPFTPHHLKSIEWEIYWLQTERPVSIEKLLNCKLSDSLSKFAATAHDHTICVSDLKDKLVGFYLCCSGDKMDIVIQASQHCQAINRELVIVLAYLPFSDDPQHFIKCTDDALRSKDNNNISSSWWVLPFDDCQSRRLFSVCECHDDEPPDQLIIVGPKGKFMERRAANALTHTPSSMTDMYPFAAEALARQETDRLSSLSLDSLLFPPDTPIDYLISLSSKKHIYLPYLLGKNVILFVVNCQYEYSSECFSSMRAWCHANGGKQDSDTLLVFVPLHSTHNFTCKSDSHSEVAWLWDSSLSWLLCPCDSARESSIIKHATLQGLRLPNLMYISFGKEGRILSTACPQLSGRKGLSTLGGDQLYEELLEEYLGEFFYD